MNLAITDAGQIVSMRQNKFFSVSEIADPDEIAEKLKIQRTTVPGLLSNIPKFPYEQWLWTVGFHRWSFKMFKKETHLSHFITQNNEFITLPFHQVVEGMTIKIDLNTPENQELLNSLVVEYGIDLGGFHGTTHNHVNMSAFQSGTDKHDEDGQQGVHFTLGNLGQQDMSIHARVSAIFNGDMSLIEEGKPLPSGAKILKKMVDLPSTAILSFLDIPYLDKNFKEMPKEYIDAAMKRYVTGIGYTEEIPFPEEWKSRVTEKKYSPTNVWVGKHGATTTGGILPPSMGTVEKKDPKEVQRRNGKVTTSGLSTNDRTLLSSSFQSGFLILFSIVAKAKARYPKLGKFNSKELIEALSKIEIADKNDRDLTEFHVQYSREAYVNHSAKVLLTCMENDGLAWDKAWAALQLKNNNAASSHAYRLSKEFVDAFDPLYLSAVDV